MRMVIVGGGKVGWNLARIMLERRHNVSLIEKDRQRCERLADDLDAAIYRGDGTNVGVLEAAGAQNADVFMTVTGSDQDNLVACQVARDHFHAKKVISRVNDPRKEILTKMIEQEADLAHMHLIATLNQGKAGICSMTLPSNTALDGVALKDIDLPGGTLVISLIRRGVLTIPNGSTTLQAGDELVAVSEERSQKALMRALAETVR